ncbi:MAG: hypothetical protein AAGH15_17115 [Myxococcota bacterium]
MFASPRLLMLGLLACGSSPAPAALPEPVRFAPCALGTQRLELPVPEGRVLVAAPEACVLAREEDDGTLLVITALESGTEAFEAARDDPDRFVAGLALLGSAPERTGAGGARFLGRERRTTRWRTSVDPYGAREVHSLRAEALAPAGLQVLLVLAIHAPGDSEAASSLFAILAAARLPRD